MSDSIEPVEVLQNILKTIVSDTESKEEIIKIWFYVGRMMGIASLFPEMQVIVTPDEKGVRQPILLIASLHSSVLDYLTDEKILTEEIAQICLDEIKNMEIIH